MAMANQFMQANSAGQSPQTVGGMPPPLPTTVAFFAAIDGKQSGAMDQNQLQDAVNQGKLTRATLVWTQGMAKWTAAAEVPALAGLFASVPPPLPPA